MFFKLDPDVEELEQQHGCGGDAGVEREQRLLAALVGHEDQHVLAVDVADEAVHCARGHASGHLRVADLGLQNMAKLNGIQEGDK